MLYTKDHKTTTLNHNRTHINPIVGDKVTFLKTAAETNGKETLAEVELVANAKGTPAHYHTSTIETFTVLEGTLDVHINKQKLKLEKGDCVAVPLYARHKFFNSSHQPVKFTVQLSPGSPCFENGLKIAYALAREGKCNKHSIRKNMYHFALLFDMREGRIPGITSLFMPVLKRKAAKSGKKGVEKELIEKLWLIGYALRMKATKRCAN